jgi:leader peptidase (prepilin peptidase)/N-methyltransferase
VALLLAGAAVDLEHMILPNEITIGAALIALATAHFRSAGIAGSLLGAGAGFAVTYVPFLLYKRIRGHSGMGMGDAKLAVTAGAWLGLEGAFFVLFAGTLQQALCALFMRVLGLRYAIPESVRAEIEELRRRAAAGDEGAKAELADDPMAAERGDAGSLRATTLPLGPFLVLSAIEFVFVGRPLVEAFLRLGAGR